MDALKLIDALGGTSAVSALVGVKAPSVSGWKESGRIPDDKLIRLAPIAEARGIATRKELFPTDWQAIWPELADPPHDQPPEQALAESPAGEGQGA